jgi:hypothetical protein
MACASAPIPNAPGPGSLNPGFLYSYLPG